MALEHDLDSALARAVRAVGSQSAFARLIGKRQSTVHSWLKNNTALPVAHLQKVEAATGISRHELLPDAFGPPPAVIDSLPPLPDADDGMEVAR